MGDIGKKGKEREGRKEKEKKKREREREEKTEKKFFFPPKQLNIAFLVVDRVDFLDTIE